MMGGYYCEAAGNCRCNARASQATWDAAWWGHRALISEGSVFFVNGECKPDGAVVLSTVSDADSTWNLVVHLQRSWHEYFVDRD